MKQLNKQVRTHVLSTSSPHKTYNHRKFPVALFLSRQHAVEVSPPTREAKKKEKEKAE